MSGIVHSWKSYTANKANRLLRRQGDFWHRDYFDRYIRDDRHFAAAVRYIEENPLRAGLCAAQVEWPFGSAARALRHGELTDEENISAGNERI